MPARTNDDHTDGGGSRARGHEPPSRRESLQPDPGAIPLRLRVLQELLDQSMRLATGAILLCALAAGMTHSQGPDLAEALANSLSWVALAVFAFSLSVEVLHYLRRSEATAMLCQRRRAIDAALAVLVAAHLVARVGKMTVTGAVGVSWATLLHGATYATLLLRGIVAARRSPGARATYETTGYVGAGCCAVMLAIRGASSASLVDTASNFVALAALVGVASMRAWVRRASR